MTDYRQVGGRLGAYIRANNPTSQQIKALLGDLLAGDELLVTMRELVSRPSFAAVQFHAGRGGGSIQRDSLLQEIRRSYTPEVLTSVSELLNGLLDLSKIPSEGSSKWQYHAEASEDWAAEHRLTRKIDEPSLTERSKKDNASLEIDKTQVEAERLQTRNHQLMQELEQSLNKEAHLKVANRQYEDKIVSIEAFFQTTLVVISILLILMTFAVLASLDNVAIALIALLSLLVYRLSRIDISNV